MTSNRPGTERKLNPWTGPQSLRYPRQRTRRTAGILHWGNAGSCDRACAAIRARRPPPGGRLATTAWRRSRSCGTPMMDPTAVRWLTGSSGRSGSTCCSLSAAFYHNPEHDLPAITAGRPDSRHHAPPVRSRSAGYGISAFRNRTGSPGRRTDTGRINAGGRHLLRPQTAYDDIAVQSGNRPQTTCRDARNEIKDWRTGLSHLILIKRHRYLAPTTSFQLLIKGIWQLRIRQTA